MNKRNYLIFVLFILLGIIIGPATASAGWLFNVELRSGGVFNQTDLQGKWYLYDWTAYGTITVDGTGNVTGGQITALGGGNWNFIGGNLSLSAAGVVTGTIQVDSGITMNVINGKVDLNKQTAFMGWQGGGGQGTLYLVNAGNAFATADMQGRWYFYGFNSLGQGSYGIVDFSNLGAVTGGTFYYLSGGTSTITAGNSALDANGKFSGNFSDSGGINYTVLDGKMNSDKDFIICDMYANVGAYVFGILVKGGGSFTAADLTGTWYTYAVEHTSASGYGTTSISGSGDMSGTFTSLYTGATINVSGTMTINTIGTLGGSAVMADKTAGDSSSGATYAGDVVYPSAGMMDNGSFFPAQAADGGGTLANVSLDYSGSLFAGKMDASKNIMVSLMNVNSGGSGGGGGGGGGGCFVDWGG
jgi:hypothetical protein